MSATGRGTVRHRDDYYITPKWCIENFMAWANKNLFILRNSDALDAMYILDPCAGGDKDNPVMPYPVVLKEMVEHNALYIITNDIRKDSPAFLHTDFTLYKELETVGGLRNYAMIISNPPYKIATDFVEAALNRVEERGEVIMLLRVNFFGSQKRNEWFEKFRPEWAVVSSRRPSFRADGQTDASEYAHFIWNKRWDKSYTKTETI
jgi:hypothetical protein